MPLLVCPEPSKLKAENQAESKAAHKVGYAHRLCGETPDVYLTAQGLDHSQTSQEHLSITILCLRQTVNFAYL